MKLKLLSVNSMRKDMQIQQDLSHMDVNKKNAFLFSLEDLIYRIWHIVSSILTVISIFAEGPSAMISNVLQSK